MKNKVVLLAMFTAIVAYDCFSISPGISADSPGGSFQPVVLERRELVAGASLSWETELPGSAPHRCSRNGRSAAAIAVPGCDGAAPRALIIDKMG